MAALVDDLHVLPGHLILLALTLVQQIQFTHLFFHGRLLEQLTLEIQQGDKIELPDQNGNGKAQRSLFGAGIVQHGGLHHEQDANEERAEQLPGPDVVFSFIRKLPCQQDVHRRKEYRPGQQLYQNRPRGSHVQRVSIPGKLQLQKAPALVGALRDEQAPYCAVQGTFFIDIRTQIDHPAQQRKKGDVKHQQQELLLPQCCGLCQRVQQLRQQKQREQHPAGARPEMGAMPQRQTKDQRRAPAQQRPEQAVQQRCGHSTPPM